VHPDIARPPRSESTAHDSHRLFTTSECRLPPPLAITQPRQRSADDHRDASDRQFHHPARASKVAPTPCTIAISRCGSRPPTPQSSTRRSQIPITQGAAPPSHCLPAVSSLEASRTPAARARPTVLSRQASEKLLNNSARPEGPNERPLRVDSGRSRARVHGKGERTCLMPDRLDPTISTARSAAAPASTKSSLPLRYQRPVCRGCAPAPAARAPA
jgi:hypothetical protein